MADIADFQVAITAKIDEFVARWGQDALDEFREIVRIGDVTAWEGSVDEIMAEIENRMAMGADSIAWQGYQLGRVEEIDAAGQKFYWVLDPGASHCETCLEYAAGGPYTLDDLPGIPGDAPTDCNGGCRCDLVPANG